MTDGPATEFYFSEDAPAFETTRGNPLWAPALRDGVNFLALALAAGESATSPLLVIEHDSTLVCEIGSGVVSIALESEDDPTDIARIGAASAVTIDLSNLRGRVGRIALFAEQDATVLKWVVGRSDRIGLLLARTHHSRRISNETKHFTTVYDHDIYKSRNVSSKGAGYEVPAGSLDRDARSLPDAVAIGAMPAAEVRPGENAHAYALRILDSLVAESVPNFAARLHALHRDRPVRVLSLCSGAAGVERSILENAGVPSEITLFDINPELMGRAAATLAPFAKVYGVVGDVNEIALELFDHTYDVVMCVSGLHHVVELENVVSTASQLLAPQGEFWIVGEQIGRNGNRMWPEVRAAANAAFAALPRELRKNTNDGQIDDVIRENDFSATSFEGIRSEEIERLLAAVFEPVEVYRRNCFLWRLVEPTYFANYDLADDGHRRALHGLIAAEYAIWRQGGRPVEAWSVYRRR